MTNPFVMSFQFPSDIDGEDIVAEITQDLQEATGQGLPALTRQALIDTINRSNKAHSDALYVNTVTMGAEPLDENHLAPLTFEFSTERVDQPVSEENNTSIEEALSLSAVAAAIDSFGVTNVILGHNLVEGLMKSELTRFLEFDVHGNVSYAPYVLQYYLDDMMENKEFYHQYHEVVDAYQPLAKILDIIFAQSDKLDPELFCYNILGFGEVILYGCENDIIKVVCAEAGEDRQIPAAFVAGLYYVYKANPEVSGMMSWKTLLETFNAWETK